MTKSQIENEVLFCNFCGKNQRDVKKLIAAAHLLISGLPACICNECVEFCQLVLNKDDHD